MSSGSERYLAGEHLPAHAQVTADTEPRVFESGGLVVLEKEMACPGKGIGLNNTHSKQPPYLCEQGSDEQRQANRCSGKVQPPASAVRVFAEVKRVILI